MHQADVSEQASCHGLGKTGRFCNGCEFPEGLQLPPEMLALATFIANASMPDWYRWGDTLFDLYSDRRADDASCVGSAYCFFDSLACNRKSNICPLC